MNTEPSDESRLLAALREYQEAAEKGLRPDRRQLLARHPEIGPALRDCLRSLALVHSAAGLGIPAAGKK